MAFYLDSFPGLKKVTAYLNPQFLCLDPVKTLATGVISKLMIQTREPIPTCTLLNPVSLLWTRHFKHSAYATNFLFLLLIIL